MLHLYISEISTFHGRLKRMAASVTTEVSHGKKVIAGYYYDGDKQYR